MEAMMREAISAIAETTAMEGSAAAVPTATMEASAVETSAMPAAAVETTSMKTAAAAAVEAAAAMTTVDLGH
jgi:hypothetical protein